MAAALSISPTAACGGGRTDPGSDRAGGAPPAQATAKHDPASPPAAPEAEGHTQPPSGDDAPPAARKPRRGPLAATAEDDLGKLPEGVGVAVGERAPAVTLPNSAGHPLDLAKRYAEGPTLVIFYRGGWCPFCNAQIHDLTQAYPEFEARGVTPVAISVDRIEEASRTQATYTIPFPVLSDPDLVAHRAFKVLQPLDPAYVAKIKAFGMDVEAASGKTHHTVAIPSAFLVDRAGVVRWAHADPDYKVRPSPVQLLAAIDRSLGAATGEGRLRHAP